MATKKKPANAGVLKKSPSAVHESFADYITETTGVETDAATVALVQRLYPLYLKSPDVAAARAAEKAERDAAKSEREAAKKARLQARLDKIEAQRQKVLASMGLSGVSEVVDASERFTDGGGITFAQADDDDDEDDAEVEVVAGEIVPDDDEDEDWDDDEDDEEDF